MEKIDLRREYVTGNKRNELLKELRFLEGQIEDAETYAAKDRIPTIKHNLAQTKQRLEYFTPPKVNARMRDKLAAEKKELEEKIAENMITEKEGWVTDPYERQRAVRKCLNYKMNFEGMAARLRNINKILEPENTEIHNLQYVHRRKIQG